MSEHDAMVLGVPAELAALRAWVVRGAGAEPKAPAGRWKEPERWDTLAVRMRQAEQCGASGVGIVVNPAAGLLGIDFDHVHDPATGDLLPWAAEGQRLCIEAGAWVEWSMSRTGFHAVLRGTADSTWERTRKRADCPAMEQDAEQERAMGGACKLEQWDGRKQGTDESGVRHLAVTGDTIHTPRTLGTLRAGDALHTWLHAMLHEAPAPKRSAAPAPWSGSVQVLGSTRVGDDYSAHWQEVMPPLLERHGWKYLRTDGENQRWQRPAKNGDGISASLGIAGAHAGKLFVFSSSAAPLEADRGYSAFQVYAVLEHGGDWSAAARALAAEGYGEQRPARVQAKRIGSDGTPPPAAAPLPDTVDERIELAQRANANTQGLLHRGIVVPEYAALTHALDGISGWCLLTGGTGVGKTTLTLGIALSVALRGRLGIRQHRGGVDPDAMLPQRALDPDAERPAVSEHAEVVYLSTEMTWADQYHAMVCMLAQVGFREYATRRAQLLEADRCAVDAAERTVRELMTGGHLHLLTADDVAWEPLPHALAGVQERHALAGVQERVEELTQGRRALVIIDTLHTMPVAAEDDYQRDGMVVAGCTALRQALEVSHGALLTVTEEAKHLTGSTDVHSVKGSSAYGYRCSQRLTLASAAAQGGTRALKVRTGDDGDAGDATEVDMHILKARQGGYGGAVVPMLHTYHHGRLLEMPARTMHGTCTSVSAPYLHGDVPAPCFYTHSQLQKAMREVK